MEITINKEDFERVLPVAACAHDEVFEKVAAYFSRSWDELCGRFFDDGDMTVFIEDDKICRDLKTYVILHSFLAVFRQMDLVLTPTGFGVVGNNELTPASKQRVDALLANVRWQLQDAESALLQHLIFIPDWGKSAAAKRNIRSLVYCQRVLCRLLRSDSRDPDFYNASLQAVGETDFIISELISAGQYDEILECVRTGKLEGRMLDASLAMLDVFKAHLQGNREFERQACRALIDCLDQYPESFAAYHSSRQYKAIHYEHEKNTSDSPAFFFG